MFGFAEGSMEGNGGRIGMWRGRRETGMKTGYVMEVRDEEAASMGPVVGTVAAVGNSEARPKTWRASSEKEECP